MSLERLSLDKQTQMSGNTQVDIDNKMGQKGALGNVFISWECYNNSAQMRWLKTAEIYSLTVLEASILKSDFKQCRLHLETLRGNLCHISFLVFQCQVMASIPGVPWFIDTSLHSLHLLLRCLLCVSAFSPTVSRTQVFIFSAYPWAQVVKDRLQCWRPGFNPWVGKIPWRRERLPMPVFWPGEFH